jgi:hypothetical protein
VRGWSLCRRAGGKRRGCGRAWKVATPGEVRRASA